MSWADLFGDATPVLRRSVVEGERFGLTVERLTVPLDSSATDADLAALASSCTADVLVMRYPAERVRLFAHLVEGDRSVLLADTLVYWSLRVGEGHRPATVPDLIVRRQALDATDVAALVGDVFAGYENHYRANPLFDPEKALAGYQDWAARSIARAQPVVVSRQAEPIALATLAAQGSVVEIELAGVVAREQGRGVYGHLLAGVEDVAAADGHDRVVISTQGHNMKVQRAWARYGFEPSGTFLTVHLIAAGRGALQRRSAPG